MTVALPAIVALLLSAAPAAVLAEELMPSWILPGILAVESRSYYQDGGIVYVDRRVGAAGELGPFQITPDAFADVAHRGEHVRRLRFSVALGQEIATRILQRHCDATGSWSEAVIRYHVGAHGDRATGMRYLDLVRFAGLSYLAHAP